EARRSRVPSLQLGLPTWLLCPPPFGSDGALRSVHARARWHGPHGRGQVIGYERRDSRPAVSAPLTSEVARCKGAVGLVVWTAGARRSRLSRKSARSWWRAPTSFETNGSYARGGSKPSSLARPSFAAAAGVERSFRV